jgi:hypothetical protein
MQTLSLRPTAVAAQALPTPTTARVDLGLTAVTSIDVYLIGVYLIDGHGVRRVLRRRRVRR